ncbi:MAG: carbohydrate kinase [Eubacterium sp.]|nr:carbohydrate kinase [Eubacterium sp.]
MEKEVDIVALGELLIDFTEAGKSSSGKKLFEQNPGGAPANLLTVAAHMGYQTEFIGKVGADMHGDFLKKTLEEEGIGTRYLIQDESFFTTLAFVEIAENGERHFSFSRKPGADTQLRAEELNQQLLENCKIFHFGALSLTNEPSRTATIEAVKGAKAAGVLISYDPNYRESLWFDKQTAVSQMKSMIPYADIMKVSDEELVLLTGIEDYNKAVTQLLELGPKLVAVTLGSDGVLLAREYKREKVEGFKVNAIDTTGAGDSFWGGFLSEYLKQEKSLEEFTWEEIKNCAVYGNATAALCVQRRGGIPAIPKKKEVEQFINMKSYFSDI